ncbi:hypothetical protein UFOVP285_73 [uncultured Caudovirales phage]|uniref:Uncharacterized protein n=1 Tax=uncultured Caudovirales phage TaxID=2100421 RepID=A0A6J5LM05_9CAUD|nr:hypothetical protein UFOVP285_73 [uncultured Caudovirales phage]
MIYIYLALTLSVSLLTVCISKATDATPLWAVIGLVVSAFTFGYILGESHE